MPTDGVGAVVAGIEYDACGEEFFVSAVPDLDRFPYRFASALGVRFDSATGPRYLRQRWHDASLQRFISRDPIGLAGGPNLYTYTKNSPVDNVDPLGLYVDYKRNGKR